MIFISVKEQAAGMSALFALDITLYDLPYLKSFTIETCLSNRGSEQYEEQMTIKSQPRHLCKVPRVLQMYSLSLSPLIIMLLQDFIRQKKTVKWWLWQKALPRLSLYNL